MILLHELFMIIQRKRESEEPYVYEWKIIDR